MLEGIEKLRVIGLIIEEIYSDFARDMIRSIQGAMTQHKNLRLVVLEGKQCQHIPLLLFQLVPTQTDLNL